MIDERRRKNIPKMRKFFFQLKIVQLQEKKLSRITFDHISKLGEEFLGQLFCPLNEKWGRFLCSR